MPFSRLFEWSRPYCSRRREGENSTGQDPRIVLGPPDSGAWKKRKKMIISASYEVFEPHFFVGNKRLLLLKKAWDWLDEDSTV